MLCCVVLCCCRPGPGGKQCLGGSVEHKVCEGPPCTKGSPTFRDQQCQSYERQVGKKKSQMWTAVVNDGEETHTLALPPSPPLSLSVSHNIHLHLGLLLLQTLIENNKPHNFLYYVVLTPTYTRVTMFSCLTVCLSPSQCQGTAADYMCQA